MWGLNSDTKIKSCPVTYSSIFITMQVSFPLQHHNMPYFLPNLIGLILRFIVCVQPSMEFFFDDSAYWEVLSSILAKNVNDDYTSESSAHPKPKCLFVIFVIKLDKLPNYRKRLRQCIQTDKIRS